MPIRSMSKTVIAMGEGDILTGIAVDSYGVGHFVFQAAEEAKEPGTPAPELDGKYGVGDADLVVMFKDRGDVDRMIATLEKLKTAMGAPRP